MCAIFSFKSRFKLEISWFRKKTSPGEIIFKKSFLLCISNIKYEKVKKRSLKNCNGLLNFFF